MCVQPLHCYAFCLGPVVDTQSPWGCPHLSTQVHLHGDGVARAGHLDSAFEELSPWGWEVRERASGGDGGLPGLVLPD